ncbi:glycosyl transferase [Aphanothece hegewaldii CCALA 016]|uniref:Glycosyl transferase n=1 Tax=Aphanothece hegewaldii CCALA 016 TaxID=2107694 RepID=A0A2T1M424_9CHRO|nr:glycosyl transferase [Aphanothece hegewaldii]PSF39589.1 glycosyl transferase [Aphanothece hegewaldii CCALA 016]
MSRPTLYVAITNHGFGHAVRSASVVAAIQRLNPDILTILVTTAPHWLLESYISFDFIQRHRGFDVGVIQSDSLKMDKIATLAKLQDIKAHERSIIASEVNFIRTNQVGLILADIPPLAAVIAKAAGIPCWMMSNFGWDFIYRDWGEDFQEITDWMSSCYQQCDRLFRLPLSESMSAFPNIIDVGLTGGNPRYSETHLRTHFNLTAPKEKTILLTFGGLGLEQIPYQNLQHFQKWQFITFDRNIPRLQNLIQVTEHQYRPVDFMPFCGRVISKPGFSTFSEALRQNTPIVSLTRDNFAESHFLLDGIQKYSEHQIITPQEFFQGNWDFLHDSLIPPKYNISIDKNGSETIAKAIVNYFQSHP